MAFLDGFVTPVRAGARDAYRAGAEKASALFVEHGALRMVEAIGADVSHGEQTDFWRAVAAEDGEEIAFSWVLWPSRQARDAGWAKVMADPRLKDLDSAAFDGKRMIFGGFDVILDTGVAGGA